MKKSKRALTALLVAGAVSSFAACGDDNDGSGTQDPTTSNPNPAGAGGNGPTTGGTTGGGTTGGDEALSACPDHPNVTDGGAVCVLRAPTGDEIKTDLTLAPVAGKRGYLIQDGVFVGEDVGGGATADATKAKATLTILPGTQVFGASPLSFLLINRGSKIEAAGTKEAPVVFTSAQQTPKPGDWGGLVINGRAPTNQGTDVSGEADTGKYGGPDAADDSGTLRYVRLEFTGGKVDPMNELNGIAFQGVGHGTEVDYVQVHGSDDDGIEWFGGTVNAKHLVVTAPGDDGLDWVGGYTGKIQYAIVQQWTRVSSSDPNGIEADNLQAMPAATPISSPTIANLTLIGGAGVMNAKGALLRRGTQANLYSAVVLGFNTGCLHVDGPESTAFVGTQLSMAASRLSCATNFISPPASQQLFEAGGAGNVAVPVGQNLLTDATSETAPNFTPADAALLTGGRTPEDPFFTSEPFIGAVGSTDWTEGWVKVSPVGG